MGTNRGLEATGGEIKTKMRFGKQTGDVGSVPGTPVVRESLPDDILGQVDMDGTIYINKDLTPGSYEFNQTLIHEMRHATDIKIGKLAYEDDYITYNGETFPRETRNGRDMIKVEGKWKEAGDTSFPWENDANNGNEEV